jgi:peptidoglycan/xylan/chitin deacetylase (PgdA/CDA1 family)
VCSIAVVTCGGGLPRAQPDGAAQTPATTGEIQTTTSTSAATSRAGSATTGPVPTVAGASTTTAPLAGAPALPIRKGTNGRKIVALTFDAGSDVGFTAQILDTLKAEKIRASFGMTGKWAEQNPDVFRRIVAEGHHLVNHTYSHRSWTGFSSSTGLLNREGRIAELDKAEQVFQTLAGISAKPWYRPPFGDVDNETDKLLGQQGYKYDALWTVDSLGWMGKTAPQIVEICRKGFVAGGILLFHVGEQSQDANALVQIIKEIRVAGLQPGSLLDVV